MIVQACINGARPAAFHPALPLTAEAMARDATACVAAGAAELHLYRAHPTAGEPVGFSHGPDDAGDAPSLPGHADWRVHRGVD